MVSHHSGDSVGFRFVENTDDYEKLIEDIKSSSGPIALDAERASSFRYTSKAYLLQLNADGIGPTVIDPLAISSLDHLCRWANQHLVVLHSATQDLECLREIGIDPIALFDTELAAKLLGKPRVGLQALLEAELAIHIEKEHSAVNWSTRPLPEDWLLYAAKDVEYLLQLFEILSEQLEVSNRMQWALQEFDYLTKWQPKVVTEKWRRTSGLHKVKQRRQLAAVMFLWDARDAIAASNDLSPSKVLRDEALIEIALSHATSASSLQSLLKQKFRVKVDHSQIWWQALQNSLEVDDANLPVFHQRNPNGLPPIKAWTEKNPQAAERFQRARHQIVSISTDLNIAPEVLINPETIRQISWHFDNWDKEFLLEELRRVETRQWQVDLVFEHIFDALRHN